MCWRNHSLNFPFLLLSLNPPRPGHRLSYGQPAKLPPFVQPTDPKRKRSTKGKDPVDGGRSRTSQEEDEGRRVSKQLRVALQGQEKEVVA